MKISIFASIGSQNLGDELILKNEINILEERFSMKNNIPKKEIKFSIFTYDLNDVFYDARNLKYIEYFPIDIKNKKNIFRNIKNFINFIKIVIKSDLIVVGGGGIIYDNENQSVGSPLKQWVFRSNIFKFFNKKVEFFRVGINIKNKINLNLVKKIFSCADKISVRDNYSYNLLEKLGFGHLLGIREFDPVFYDNNIDMFLKINYLKKDIDIKDLNLENIKKINNNLGNNFFYGKKIGLSLRDYNIDNYKENIVEIIKYFLKEKAEIILIPHSFHKTDNKANDFIFLDSCRKESLKHINVDSNKIYICKNMKESYENYTEKKIDLNLASRLHSIILSQVYEIDFIGISYSKKTDEVLKIFRNS